MKRKYNSFIKSHNLINRIYDMFIYFDLFRGKKYDELETKKIIRKNIKSIFYVETLAKYLESKKRKTKNNIDLRCNLYDLINDLNFLKQYL